MGSEGNNKRGQRRCRAAAGKTFEGSRKLQDICNYFEALKAIRFDSVWVVDLDGTTIGGAAGSFRVNSWGGEKIHELLLLILSLLQEAEVSWASLTSARYLHLRIFIISTKLYCVP